MKSLREVADSPEDLDRYEVDHLFHSWSYLPERSPERIVAAQGVRCTTESGRELLDFASCFVSHNLGHGDRRVLDAIHRQTDELVSFAPVFSTRPRAKLARVLAEVTPGDLSRSFIVTGGAEANETAFKIAHQVTGRRKIVTHYQTFHGGTTAAMSASTAPWRSTRRYHAIALPSSPAANRARAAAGANQTRSALGGRVSSAGRVPWTATA